MHRGILYIMAKEPRPGQVKTRLCPPLTFRQACRVAEAFAIDTITKLASLDEIVEVRLALAEAGEPGGEVEYRGPQGRAELGDRGNDDGSSEPQELPGGLEALAADLGIVVEGQGSGNLGARMARLLGRGLETGLPAILVGTDSPDLPLATILSALDALGRVDVAIAPAHDGGYVLVGARRIVAALFEIAVPWGSEHVFAATSESLRRDRCAYEVLPAWGDVDDAAALGRLAARLGGAGAEAPVTARLLDGWRREGVRF